MQKTQSQNHVHVMLGHCNVAAMNQHYPNIVSKSLVAEAKWSTLKLTYPALICTNLINSPVSPVIIGVLCVTWKNWDIGLESINSLTSWTCQQHVQFRHAAAYFCSSFYIPWHNRNVDLRLFHSWFSVYNAGSTFTPALGVFRGSLLVNN